MVNLPGLRGLVMTSDPGLSYIEPGVFSCCPLLSSLQLGFNNTVIESGVFTDLPKLNGVLLSGVRALGQIVNTPLLFSVTLRISGFLSSSLLDRCGCTLSDTDIQSPSCLPGSEAALGNTFTGSACKPGFMCSILEPVPCNFGTTVRGGYVPACPTASYRNSSACLLCAAGSYLSTNASCISYISVGSLTSLSVSQYEEFQHPPESVDC